MIRLREIEKRFTHPAHMFKAIFDTQNVENVNDLLDEFIEEHTNGKIKEDDYYEMAVILNQMIYYILLQKLDRKSFSKEDVFDFAKTVLDEIYDH